MIVTAFGPFGRFSVNPSEVIGRTLFGDDLVVLPVSYRAVDEFVGTVPQDTLLMLGVAARARSIRLERIASSSIGNTLDTEAESRTRSGHDSVKGTLFDTIGLSDCWQESDDAGGYRCNYLYYEATKRLPRAKTGFVHVAPFSNLPMRLQLSRLRRLIAKIKPA